MDYRHFSAALFLLFAATVCAQPSSPNGATVTHPLPFMLFASDNVSEVILNEPTCVFVTAARFFKDRVAKLTFTLKHSNGSRSTVKTSEFVRLAEEGFVVQGKLCFESSVQSVLLNQNGLYEGYKRGDSAWRNTILLFVRKDKVEGPCKFVGSMGGGVHSVTFGEPRLVNVSADCPLFLLSPTNISDASVIPDQCPGFTIATYVDADPRVANWFHLPKGVRVDVETLQNGLRPIDDPHLFTLTNETIRAFNSQMLLRSAIVVKTASSEWLNNVFLELNDNFEQDAPSNCLLYHFANTSFSDVLIDSDPYGDEDFVMNIELPLDNTFKQPSFSFDIADYDEKCVHLTLTHTLINGTQKTTQNPTGFVQFDMTKYVSVIFIRVKTPQCANAQIRMRYSLRELFGVTTTPTVTSASTDKPITRTSMKSLLSSVLIVFVTFLLF